ncbi:MAG: polyprenyl diphosphate synthase [Acidobacteriota bacterium]
MPSTPAHTAPFRPLQRERDARDAAMPERMGDRLRLWGQGVKERIKQPFYLAYRRRLRNKLRDWTLPHHIGIIMDGNRRFARAAGRSNVCYGHGRGAEKLHEVLDWCYDADIRVVTVWCLSLDNFQRSTDELASLLALFEDKTREMAEGETVHRHRVRVRYIGERQRLPDSLQREMARLERETAHYDSFVLNIAMAYGGREEIAEACRRYIGDRASAGWTPEQIATALDADALGGFLYTADQPEPDLILRTSGEVRLSGFLLWQSAHAEFYFCDAHWPAFREIDFLRALRSYDLRQRRFGR